MRIHLFEFEDFSWFPDIIRSGGTDYLRYFLIHTALYQPTISLLNDTLKTTHENNIVDLCSGGGGYMEQISEGLSQLNNTTFKITLTDKFPNEKTFLYIKEKSKGKIDYCACSVDVFQIPKDLKGIRVLFSAVHHFKPDQVKKILQNAVDDACPIAFFDGGEKSIFAILGLLIIHPVAFFVFTPFFRPFKLSRIFFTYILPVIPLYTIWDGVVSILRMYQPEELRKIADFIENNNYVWKHGKTKNRFGLKATYLIGYLKNEN